MCHFTNLCYRDFRYSFFIQQMDETITYTLSGSLAADIHVFLPFWQHSKKICWLFFAFSLIIIWAEQFFNTCCQICSIHHCRKGITHETFLFRKNAAITDPVRRCHKDRAYSGIFCWPVPCVYGLQWPCRNLSDSVLYRCFGCYWYHSDMDALDLQNHQQSGRSLDRPYDRQNKNSPGQSPAMNFLLRCFTNRLRHWTICGPQSILWYPDCLGCDQL